MKLSSVFNKANYKTIYYLLKPYPKGVKNGGVDYKGIESLKDIVAYLNIDAFEKLVIVASGPSSRNIEFSDKALYFATNDAMKLVKDHNFVYLVNESFYRLRYLKTFVGKENWKGTFFWFASTRDNLKASGTQLLLKYIKLKHRTKKEFLITNTEDCPLLPVHKEITEFLKTELDIKYYGVNSGYVMLVLVYCMAYISNKPVEIFGLDLGEKEEGYFDKKVEIGKSVKGDKAKEVVGTFLTKVYKREVPVINHSYFMQNVK